MFEYYDISFNKYLGKHLKQIIISLLYYYFPTFSFTMKSTWVILWIQPEKKLIKTNGLNKYLNFSYHIFNMLRKIGGAAVSFPN